MAIFVLTVHCPPQKSLSFSIVLIRIWSDRVDAARAPALCVLLFLLIARYFALSLSVYLEGEIISNYRENRRRRKLPCASPNNNNNNNNNNNGRPNKTCRRESAIWRLSGLSSRIPAASEAIAHVVGSLCLFTVIRYSFSEGTD